MAREGTGTLADAKPNRSYQWIVLALTFVAQTSNAITALAVAPLATIFQPELGLTKAEVGFFSSAAFAGSLSVLLVTGSLTDRFGVRKMMTVGQLVSGGFVLAMSAVVSFPQAVLVMLSAGLGRGATAPGITKAVIDWFPTVGRATAVGINQSAIPVAGILTAALLPSLALAFGWRNAAAAVGIVALTGAVATGLLYRDRKGSSPQPARVSVKSNLREALRNRNLWIVAAMGPLFAGVQFSLSTYLALYYNEIALVPAIPDERARIVAAGGYLAIAHIGSASARVLWGMMSDRFFPGRRMAGLAAAGSLAALGSLAMIGAGSGAPLWMLAVLAFVAGVTLMGNQGLYMLIAGETAGARYAGSGVGMCMTGTQIGFVAGPTLFGVILDSTGSYMPAWVFLAMLAGVGTAVAAVMSWRAERGDAVTRLS